MAVWVTGVVAFTLSLALVAVARRYALRQGLLDVPGPRSSHAGETPRGGGAAVVLSAALALGLAPGLGLAPSLSAAALAGLGLVALVGFVDDHRDLPAGARLLAHLLAGVLIVLGEGGLPALLWPADQPVLGAAGSVLAVLGVAWFINLHNFMDGIDGIAATQCVTVLAGAAVILLAQDQPVPADMLAMGGACAGFLVWNWPPARIFLGDAGSGFIGGYLAALGLALSHGTFWNPWAWLILSGVFVVDATFTLVRRLLRGEPVYRPHRSHAYQILARRAGRHWPVTAGTAALNLLWLAPLAWLATVHPAAGVWLLALAWGPLVGLAVWAGAGRPEGVTG